MTTLIGLPVAFAVRHRRLQMLVQVTAGALSVAMGVVLSWEILAVSKLFG
jgi:hypothetical protein